MRICDFPSIRVHRDLSPKSTPLVALLIGSALFTGYSLVDWFEGPEPLPAMIANRAAPVNNPLNEPIQPIPYPPYADPEKIALGERLFHEPRLSQDNSIACASCHNLRAGGVDRARHSTGLGGAAGTVNAPTVFNAALNFKQFWDGRADTLEEQVDGPTHNPIEMGSSWSEILEKLSQDTEYRTAFAALYPNGLTSTAVKDAIATYERDLLTPNSRFDRFLLGETAILTPVEQTGYRLFKQYGCVACHQGANVGGNLFQKFGLMGDFFADRGLSTTTDRGRARLTGHEEHRHVFKVPSLRLAVLTPPYFHDGSVQTLDEAVSIMARYQLGRRLDQKEVAAIVAFLKTLPGEYDGKGLSDAR